VRTGAFSVALEARVDAPGSSPVAAGDVASWLYAASLVPCGHFDIASLCAVGSLGSVQAHGDVSVQRSASSLFAGAGARLGVELPMTGPLFFRAHADGLYNLHRAAYDVDGQAVWTPPPLSFVAGLGVSVHFP
jgi:hypothetical protein